MLKLENYSLNFDGKVIFDNTSFLALNSQLTLITGESGSGKTTLLNSIVLSNDFLGAYYYNDIDIMSLNDNNKEKYLSNNIYMIKQFPAFLNELTIEQHFKLFDVNYDQYDDVNCIEQLDIQKLMHEYPNQLSDGEKKRVSLCLGFICNSQVLIIDEPTASLNEEYIEIVCRLLKDYSRLGHYIIVSSHDISMKNHADTIYNIQYQKINETLNYVSQEDIKVEKRSIKINYKLYLSMFYYFIKNRIIYFVISILLISLVGVCFEFNNTVISFHKNVVNEVSSDEIKVYKLIADNPNLGYSDNGEERTISDKELEHLKTIPNIKSIEWRYEYSIMGGLNEDIDLEMDDITKMKEKVVVLNNDETKFKNIEEDRIIESLYIKTYSDNKDYSDKIEINFNKEGIYISKGFAESITQDVNELRGKLIQFPLSIPVYNINGVTTRVTESGEEIEVGAIASKKTLVSLPIAGILKGSSFYDTDINSPNHVQIFIPQEYIAEGIETYKQDKGKVIYWVIEGERMVKYYDKVPEEKKDQIVQIIKATPWQPTCYILTINDITHLDNILQEINKVGLNASCVYIDSNSLKESVESMKRGVQVVGGLIFGMLMFISFQIKKNNNKVEREGNEFLVNMGLTKKEVRSVKNGKYFTFFVIESIICFGVTYLLTQILNMQMQGNTNFSLVMCGIITLTVFIIEYIYPKIIERKE